MNESSTKTTSATSQADELGSRDLLTRLTDAGDEALEWIRSELPGGTKAVQAATDLRVRADDLGKRVSGMDELERRVATLEEELAGLRKPEKVAPKPRAS